MSCMLSNKCQGRVYACGVTGIHLNYGKTYIYTSVRYSGFMTSPLYLVVCSLEWIASLQTVVCGWLPLAIRVVGLHRDVQPPDRLRGCH